MKEWHVERMVPLAKMKKLGLIGGTGPESTVEYYRQIEYGVQEKTGVFPNLVIESLSVFDVLQFCREQDYKGLSDYLVKGFCCLADAGADFACLTGITPHIVFNEVAKRSPIPVVSIVETACKRTLERHFTKVALLGTYPTMKGSFFQNTFLSNGIDVITPTEVEMQYIGNKIEKELELSKIIPETQQRFCEIAERLASEDHVQAVVLGCTELPLLLNNNMISVPCLDVMKIHIEELIERIIQY